MPPIETTALQPLAAPLWFIIFFRILGFVLHALLMNLWLVGIPLALLLNRSRNRNARRWSSRLLRQMPVFIAFGINFGIVPLLFIQYLYGRTFYSATILMAWHWLAIIALLLPAYYGIYHYAFALKKDPDTIPGYTRAAGWIASIFFIIIGFVFVNALTLTAEPEMWKSLWLAHNSAGASVGTGSAVLNPEIWPRLGMMISLAFGTLAAWTLCDRSISSSKEESDAVPETDYHTWSAHCARILGGVGMAGFIVCALTFTSQLAQGSSLDAPLPALTNVWLAGPVLTFLALLFLAGRNGKFAAFLTLLIQIVSLSVFACVRLWIQSLQLESHLPLSQFTVKTDLGPMCLFLGTFVFGVLLLSWMLAIVVRNLRKSETA
ncbi:MAG: hypothetical protein E7029_01995 [Planctomycetaceae bacterium]|nr:hypothetical protein [Planctomycetaceae bacterium]